MFVRVQGLVTSLLLAVGLAAGATNRATLESAAVVDQPRLVLDLSARAWLVERTAQEQWLLPVGNDLPLLARYRDPERDRRVTISLAGRAHLPEMSLAWVRTPDEVAPEPPRELPASLSAPGDPNELRAPVELPAPRPAWLPGFSQPFAPELPPEPELLFPISRAACPFWQRHKMVTLDRWGGESDQLRLLECDGSIAPEALDRLSVIARPPGVPRPELPLPMDAQPDAVARGEWVDGVRLLDPRLLWIVQRIADTYPWHNVHVVSGYRRDDHDSMHSRGRALDIAVLGIQNERLLRLCRKLSDVACGYYPNSKFVHFDVRGRGSGHPVWVDIAGPGERSRYVRGWPGVVESDDPGIASGSIASE